MLVYELPNKTIMGENDATNIVVQQWPSALKAIGHGTPPLHGFGKLK
jgi:hypothetical protein